MLFSQAIKGVVKASDTDKGLPFANIAVLNSTIGAVTDINGDYYLPLPEGKYTVQVSYIGFEPIAREITVDKGKVTEMDFSMKAASIVGEEVTISAQARGQNAAINQQLRSEAIKSVVSEEQIQELPDANAAEALGRLPGVSVTRTGGEANKIVVRGLDPKYSTISINGIAVPGTESTDRSVDLSMVSQSELAGMEISKAVTADMDADAIAGAVNLTTKKAPSKRLLQADLFGYYNDLTKSADQYRLSVRYGERFFDEKLGIQLSGSSERRIRSAEEFIIKYNESDWINGDPVQLTKLELAYSDETRTRNGGSIQLDLNTGDGGQIKFNSFLSQTSRSQQKNYVGFQDGPVNYHLDDFDRNIFSINSSVVGENYIEKLKLDYGISYAYTKQQTPFSHDVRFAEAGRSDIGMNNDTLIDGKSFLDVISRDINAENPFYGEPTDFYTIPLYAYKKYEFATTNKPFSFSTNESDESNRSAFINLEYPVTITDNINLKIKAGGKVLSKFRNRETAASSGQYGNGIYGSWTHIMNPDGSITEKNWSGTPFADFGEAVGTRVTLPYFIYDPILSHSLFEREYGSNLLLEPLIDPDLLRLWYEMNKDGYNPVNDRYEYQNVPSEIKNRYSIVENVYSTYLMTVLDLGQKLKIISGVRLDMEDNAYDAVYAPDLVDDNGVAKGIIRDTSSTYRDLKVLPNFHLIYKPFSWVDFRAAYTKTLSRPDYSKRLPTLFINRTEKSITRNNPLLPTTVSNNIDLIASFYNWKFGLLTIGGFYKKMDNVAYTRNGFIIRDENDADELGLPVDQGLLAGFSLSEPVSTDDSEVFGIEIDLQANFGFASGALRNLVLRGNYTHIESRTYYPRVMYIRETGVFPPPPAERVIYLEENRMEKQPSDFGNLAIGYDIKGFSSRLSVYFQGRYFSDIAVDKIQDRFKIAYSRWDLSLKQQINKNLTAFLNITNFTNPIEGNDYRYEDLWRSRIKYGASIDLGVRLRL
jgi:TonB-dependent receptor